VKDDAIEIGVQRQLAAFEAVGQRLMPVFRLLDVEDEVRRDVVRKTHFVKQGVAPLGVSGEPTRLGHTTRACRARSSRS